MSLFKPCLGKTACRDDNVHCLSCGRSLQEIACLRESIDKLAVLAIENEYQNIDEYCAYIAQKLEKTICYRQQLSKAR